MSDEICKGECEGHPFKCYGHPYSCPCPKPPTALQELEAELASLRQRVADLTQALEAAKAFEADLSPDCDGPLRDAFRAALASQQGVTRR